MYKRLICSLLGLNLFLIVFAEASLFAEMPASYYNFGKSYVSDLGNNLLYTQKEDKEYSKSPYSTNPELRKTLLGEETGKPNRRKSLFYASLSPGLIPGISLGYGWINYDEKTNTCKEIIPSLHINGYGVLAIATGVSLSTNAFKDSNRKGLYFTGNLGIDFVGVYGPEPGGGVGSDESIFPNFSFGGGYSFPMGKNSFFRISLDVGLKWLVSNLNLSIVF